MKLTRLLGYAPYLSEGNYHLLYGGGWIESLAQSMQYRSKIGSAVPISTVTNRATSGLHLHRQQQQNKAFEKDGERRAKSSYVPLHSWWAWLWHKRDAQRRILHRVVCLFLTAVTTTVISSPSTSGWRSREKISSIRRTHLPDPIYG